ncbi:MAG TPA: hypothetical protein VHP56_10960 [Solirubrobacterales bacterium]|jgi:hypothetical protein|nr:hypothetical protein [Solirubrobacterales bacterium]
MDGELKDSFTRVEDRIARVEEELCRSCRSGEQSLHELRNEINVCLNGWVKNLVMGAVIVTCIAVVRGSN